MGFGMKFPVQQCSWDDLMDNGLFNGADSAVTGQSLSTCISTDPSNISRAKSSECGGDHTVERIVYLAENTVDAVPYYECDFVRPFVLVIGSEAHGISDKVSVTIQCSTVQ